MGTTEKDQRRTPSWQAPASGRRAQGCTPEKAPPPWDESAALNQLIVAAGRGDREAFGVACSQLIGPVYAVGWAMTGEGHRAADIAGRALLAVWRDAPCYDPARSSARAWAVAIACRTASAQAGCLAAEGPAEAASAADGAESEDAPGGSWLQGPLAGLSSLQVQAIVLALHGGCTYREIAVLLGVPASMVITAMRDGLTRLQHTRPVTPSPDSNDGYA